VFSESPDQRIEKVLAGYQTILTAAPYGWKVKVIPSDAFGDVQSYYYWVRFNDKNRVISRAINNDPLESSYRLKVLQRPELIFDTYTYLHDKIDPLASAIAAGLGAKTPTFDFEFEIISATADSVILKGKYNGNSAMLLRAAPTDSANSDRLAPYTGTYNAVGKALYYKGPEPAGVPDVVPIAGPKMAFPLVEDNTILVDFSDKRIYSGSYHITFDPGANKIIKVVPNDRLESKITPGSFKVNTSSYDPALKQIYLKSSYTDLSNQYCEVEETLTLK
jgi:hypothetical protein